MERLSSDAKIGWPKITLLGRMVELGSDAVAASRGQKNRSQAPPTYKEADAERVQKVVEQMPGEMRTVFEAYYLAIIRGVVCRRWPHAARAATLGIPKATYFTRLSAGNVFVAERLDLAIDDPDQN